MKKIVLPLLIGLAVPLVSSASTALIVHAKDGSKVSYILSERPRVSFSEDSLIITSEATVVNYPLTDMWKFTFSEEDEDTGVNNIPADEASLSINSGVIVLSGCKEGSTARICTTGGTVVHNEKLSSDSWTYPLSLLPSGIYLVTINGTTFKIAKK